LQQIIDHQVEGQAGIPFSDVLSFPKYQLSGKSLLLPLITRRPDSCNWRLD